MMAANFISYHQKKCPLNLTRDENSILNYFTKYQVEAPICLTHWGTTSPSRGDMFYYTARDSSPKGELPWRLGQFWHGITVKPNLNPDLRLDTLAKSRGSEKYILTAKW